ncbi:MAG: type I restriction enzyme HsdR N-terminal domain-containing protein [Leptolyngbya sp. SIOISBB]|nr:type I restriction enzyme HsdR N-terminal domain-containing protein [Leptolyngbya sp. SIOISBB]
MKAAHSDIIVVSPSGEYLMLVEVKLGDLVEIYQSAIEQLKYLMTLMGCAVGLAVTSTRISLLRDSLEQPNGASIHLVGEAQLPDDLRLSVTNPTANLSEVEFTDQVQQWLESLQKDDLGELSADLKALLEDSVMPLLQFGEIRAAGPRWSRVAS